MSMKRAVAVREGCLNLVTRLCPSLTGACSLCAERVFWTADVPLIVRTMPLLTFTRQNRGNGLQQNLEIEQEAPMADVADVQKHAGFEGRIFARGDLPEAGYARNDFEALFVPCAVLFHIFKRVGTRADKAHIAFEDIPELRQLVQTVFAKKPA